MGWEGWFGCDCGDGAEATVIQGEAARSNPNEAVRFTQAEGLGVGVDAEVGRMARRIPERRMEDTTTVGAGVHGKCGGGPLAWVWREAGGEMPGGGG
jgi:hypothetical protein